MLVEVENIAKFSWSPVVAQVSTPVGARGSTGDDGRALRMAEWAR